MTLEELNDVEDKDERLRLLRIYIEEILENQRRSIEAESHWDEEASREAFRES